MSIPHSFPSAAAQRGPVFSRCAFGSDLITYLFGLSSSKLHWLCVLLRAETFLPPRPVSIPSSLLAADWCHSPGEPLIEICFQPAPLLFTIPLTHAPLTSSLAGHIASAACNGLQRSLTCPPPIVTCYKSVSVTLWVDRRSKWVKEAAKIHYDSCSCFKAKLNMSG